MTLIYLDQHNKHIGTLSVKDGKAVMAGAARGVDKLHVVEPGSMAVLTPKDGDRWLNAVRYLYRAGYVRAVVA